MNIFDNLVYIGVVVWAIVPLRQYRQKYFLYFLFWGYADVATVFARFFFHSGTNFFFPTFSFLALCSLLDYGTIKKYGIILLLLFVITCLVGLDNNTLDIAGYRMVAVSLSIIHSFILFIFLKLFVTTFYKKQNLVDIFLLLLIFYEIMNAAKFLNYLTGFTNDYLYFNITTSFEILFGIFFIIFKADNKRLVFQLK